MSKLTAELARSELDYDPTTGVFRRRYGRGKFEAGGVAGTLTRDGYWQVSIRRRTYMAHRVAWLYVHGGELPPVVDHINGNKRDNRLRNLRAASVAENNRNSRMRKRNVIGLKGVSQVGEEFSAAICVNRKQIKLGLYETAEEAHEAYCRAAAKYHGAFARTF